MYAKRKSIPAANSTKICPQLTKRRSRILFKSSEFVKNIDGVHFVAANLHGDLYVRFDNLVGGKHFFNFDTFEDLKLLLLNNGFVTEEDIEDEEVDNDE